MNEQIKELAEKAGSTHKQNLGVYQFYEDELEVFAQLLIQEICKLIEPDEEWRKDASWGYIGGEEGVELLDGAISTIKGHFGVRS
jgi:hypothetical protein